MDSADKRRQVNLEGNEIDALLPYLDLCEDYRNINLQDIPPEKRQRFQILQHIYTNFQPLLLYSIDIINLIEAFSFAEEAQKPGCYRTTILKHICIPLWDLQQRIKDKKDIMGKRFRNGLKQITDCFQNSDAQSVPERFHHLRINFETRWDKDREYIRKIRNKIAAHTESDIDEVVWLYQRVDPERIRAITHDTLVFVREFLKTFDPLEEEMSPRKGNVTR